MTKNDEFDPSTARIISNNKDDEFDPSTAKLSSDTHDPNSRSWGTVASDVGNSIASGAAAAGRGILGLSDLVTGSNSIQNTKNLGLDIKSSEQAWKDNLSEKAKQEEQAWNNTQGFVDTLKYGATHPFAVANKVAESLPAMAVSGGMGGAVTKGVIGGAIGEGMQQAGSSYADAIEKNNGNTPTDKDAGAALGSGVTTATISALSGGLAKKLGIGDIDTAIANRVAGEAATSARPLGLGAYAKNIGEGIITEGALEELPQSATEQMWQNYADDKPIMEGVPEAAAQGLITGGLMGGAFNAANLPTFNESQNDEGNQGGQGQSSGPMPEVLPPDGSNGLPNNVQPNTFDGSYRDLTPSNAPQLTNEQQSESASAPSNNTPSSETPMPNGLGLNLLQLNNTTSETPEVQAASLSPSQELGIDPNQGGLSSAAAVAVDTGASPITAELQRQAIQLGYSPSENTNTPPAQQAQVADLWNSQDPQQRMAILGGIYGNEDMARQNALASFDKLPKPAQQQIADIAVQNSAVSEDNNTQSSNGQATQTAPQAPLTTLAQDIAPANQANAAPVIEPILGKDGKNKWFATQNKADEFIQKKSLGDNYTIEQTGKMRYEIVPKAQPQTEQTSQPNTGSSSKVDEQWLSNFTNQMLQDKQLSSQLSNPSNSDELTFSEFSRKFDENLAKNFTNSTDNANEQSLLQNKNDNEIAKQQAYQLAKAQINQNQQLDEQLQSSANQTMLDAAKQSGRLEIIGLNDKAETQNTSGYSPVEKRVPEGKRNAGALDIYGDWHGSLRDDYTLTPRQETLVKATQQAIDEGNFYNKDVNKRVAEILNVPQGVLEQNTNNVEDGDFGNDVYYARQYIEKKQAVAVNNQAKENLGLKQGDKIGTVITNSGKTLKNVVVQEVHDGGVTVHASSGNKRQQYTVGYDDINTSIERAVKEGKRQPFVKTSANAEQAAEAATQNNSIQPAADSTGQSATQADNAVEQRPNQSQGDGAGVGINESAVINNEADAKPSDQPGASQKLSGGLTYVGDNKDGTPLYEDDEGYRVQQVTNGLRSKETSTYTSKGIRPERRTDEFLTAEELKDKQSSQPKQTNTKDAIKKIQVEKKAAKNPIAENPQQADNKDTALQQEQNNVTDTRTANEPLSGVLAGTTPEPMETNEPSTADRLPTKNSSRSAKNDGSLYSPELDNTDNGTITGDGRYQDDISGGVEEKTTEEAIASSIEQANEPIANFTLTTNMGIGKGSMREKLAINLDIMDLLQRLEAENRKPTVEEKTLMAQYTGFGGLSDAFPNSNDEYKKGWEELGNRLKDTLIPEQYKTARASTTSAFFTPPSVIQSMWSIAERLGYNGGMVLEPSIGIGSFIGFAPNKPQGFIGSEIDGTTFAIAKHLYPQANLFNKGYETLPVADNSIDLAIGNPPYGSVKLNFVNKPHLNGKTIANQFMLSTLEQVKPNGLSIMVVSSNFMDSTNTANREEMAKLGNLEYAIRLPNSTFDDAGTAVVADILVFRKHDQATLDAITQEGLSNIPSWVKSSKISLDGVNEVNFNPFFNDKLAGELQAASGEGGRAIYTIKAKGSIDKALKDFVKSIEKVKPTRTAKQIEKEINTTNQSMIDSLVLEAEGNSIGDIRRNENGRITQVIERTDGTTSQLVERELLPSSVWSDSYTQDLDGRWYRIEDVKDKSGKSVKVLDKDGKPTKANLKQKVYFTDDKVSAQSKLGVQGYNILARSLDLLNILEMQLQLEQSSTSDSKSVEANRKELAKEYNAFVKTFGYLNNPRNAKFIKQLPKANLVFALEKSYTPEKSTGSGKNKNITQKEVAKASDILIKRMIMPKSRTNHVGTAKEALTLSLAYRGKVDLSLMAELTNKTPQVIVSELNEIESPVIFNNPATNEWETADEYLSGNIREKIKEAEQRGLTKNLQALEAVLPADVPVENIAMRLGMNWIPAEVYTDFAKHLLGTNNTLIRYEPISNTYSIYGSSTQARHDEFMGGGKSPEWLLERILNNRKIEVKVTDYITKKTILKVAETEEANEKAQAIKAEFESWLYNNGDTVAKLAELFNKVHNAIVERKFDGSHLELSGKVPDDIIKLRTHQNNAVWRGITTNAVLYDHAVGSGKTFTGIARAMERKHLGLSKKPVLVVPNHMVNQFAQDIYKLYPAANILTAGKKDFEKKNRKKLFGKIATNDYDIIVLPHSSFEFIKLSKETQKRYLEEEKARIESAIIMAKAESGSRDMTTKQLETLRANLETKIKRLTETKRNDDEIGFEQMGIDDITVDEAHEFKNLFFTTKMQGVKGLGTPTGSNKAMDLWLKTKYIHETGGALAFMTGTPISNSAAEMHAMMRYLMPKILEDNKVINFDAWANTYAENKAKFEATESGRLKLTTRFAREWQNMGSLMAMWRTVTDSVTNEDIKATYRAENNGAEFPLPRVASGNRQPVSVKPTASQEHMLELILAGFKTVEHGGLDKEEKAVLRLKLMDLATKNALDPRIIDPTLEAGGKLQAVADNTFQIYQKWNDDKGTQIIFLDRSMPKSKSDAKVIAEYDAVIAERDKAIANNDDDALLKANDKLEKFDENEIAELKSAQNGGFNAYDEIKRLLITKGIPANEIVFIQEANTDEEKKAIFDKVNSGEIRIILGSTPRMGAGTNIQQRLVALHHVDAPWKPSDIEQREGRIIRQGNELYAKYGHDNFEVEIKPYITEKTADAKRWDTMSAKLGTINAIRNYKGEHTLDFEEDDGDASFQEIAALATGNPMMLERMELTEVRSRLNRALTTYRKREAGDLGRLKSAQQSVERLPKRIEAAKSITKDYEAAAAIAKAEYDKQSITIDGKVFNSRKSANAYAKEKAELAKKADTKATYVINGENIGSYTAADTKIKELIGNKPDIPMLLEVNGKQYSNPSDMLTDNLMNKVNSHPVQPVFKLMGFDVTSYDDGGMTLMVVERDEQVLAQRSLDKQATAIKIINVINDLAKQIDSRVPLLEANLKSALKINQQTIESLQDKAGKPFPDQEQLDSVSERLTELQSILGEADKPEITDIDKMYFNELNGVLDGISNRRSGAQSAENTQPDTDTAGDAQYSQQGNRAATTKAQVIKTLSNKFGKATIDKLIADGNLEIIDYAEAKRRNPKTPSKADGYYADGKAVLIADNLSPDMIIPTFLHELGGHGGLQTLMSDKAYQSLMKEFDRMVSEGNQLAKDAKAFADATSPNAKVAQDEYLPYLISLAAKAQGNSKVKSMLNRIVMAVKSFMRDKFGVSLKVTPADIVALAEKMVSERAMQGKSITDNIGTFNPESDDIRYSQMGGSQAQQNKLTKALTEFFKNPLSFAKTVADNKYTDNLGKALALLGRRQLVDIYKKDLPPIKEYSDIVEQMDADSNEKAYEADKLVKEWGKLKDELPLAELMHDATLKGIDPAEAYQTGDDRAIYQQLRRRYDALSPDAKRIYKQARDDYKAQQRSVFEAIKGRIQRTDMSAPRQAELIRKMEQGFFFGQKVYFPLARFGNYVVAVKDAAGDIISVSRAETKGQADELRKELIAQYPNDKVGRVMLDKEFVSSRDGVTRGFMSDLFDAVDKLNISSQERAEFEDTLGQLYLNSLPDISFAKSGMHRKGTAGFSQNARRAYAQHMSRGSHYIAKMRHSDVLQAKLDEMQEYVKAQGEADPNYDQPKMQRVVDEMEKRHELLMNTAHSTLSTLATSVGFMWYMGLSPASAIVNLSQTALVAYPIMGAKWGFDKAGKELLIASRQAAKALNDIQSILTTDEKKAVEAAISSGVIDKTQAHDLAGVARGEDDSVMWKIRKPMEWASFMFHHAEKFNRQVTFVASYRLARQAGFDTKSAILQARDMTWDTQYNYEQSNRPRIMQGNWQRVIFLFKQYGQNMTYTLLRNAYLAAKGDKQALRTLAGMLVMHGTFAGILGLPLVSTLLSAASMLGGDDDEPWDAEIALRNYLAELLGDDASEVISKGLPRALGIDLSSRVGLDSLILPRMQEGLEGQRAGENALAAFSGPVFGIGVNAMAGISDIQNGNTLIGTEKLLPKAVRDLVKTYRYATEGIVDKTGIEIMPQENVSLNDIGQQVLGFRSAKIAQAQEGKSAIYKMDKEIGSKRQRLMNRYAKAYMAGDVVAADEAWQDIKRFNAGIGKDYPKLKITKPKLMQSIKQRRRRIDDAEDGIYLPSSREASRQYGAFATE